MILVDTVQEYMDMRRSFGLEAEQESYVRGKVHSPWMLYDLRRLNPRAFSDDKSWRPVCWTGTSTPGHTLEDAWFLLEFLEEYGELDKYLPLYCADRKAHLPLGMGRRENTAACFAGLWIGRAARPGVTARHTV